MNAPLYRDKIITEVVDKYPNISLPWLLQCGYCRDILKKPIVTEEVFDALSSLVVREWDNLISPYKKKTKKPAHKNDFDFSALSPLLKTAAEAQVRETYPKGVDMPVNVTPKRKITPEVLKETPKIGVAVELRVGLLQSAGLKSEELTEIGKKYGLFFSGIARFYGVFSTRIAATSRTYSLLSELHNKGVTIEEYVISDLLIDSKKKDEWNFLTARGN